MSRVARSARVASRQRPETLGLNTVEGIDKTITEAETGKLFFIDHNHASTLTITLPPAQEGAYFRFQFVRHLTANGKVEIVKPASMANGTIKGTITGLVYTTAFGDANAGTKKDAGSATKVELIDDIHVGSYVECYSDGTNWQFNGGIIADALGAGAFDA